MARPTAHFSPDERLFATRYKQGGRTVYLLALTPAEVVGLVTRPDPNAPITGNRRVSAKRASDFAGYYLDQESWVIPGLILRAPNVFTFEQDDAISQEGMSFGVVSFNKRDSLAIQILDGQHRILGFHLALERIQAQLEKARTSRNRASKNQDDPLTAHHQGTIDKYDRLLDRFYKERVSVEIQITDDTKQWRQMFFDITNNAKGVSESVKTQFDTRKVINRALPFILDHPLLDGRVDMERDRLGRPSVYLLTLKHVAEIAKACSVGFWGRMGKHIEASLHERDIERYTREFLDLIAEIFPPLAEVESGLLTPEGLRRTTILGSPHFLRQLAGVYYEIVRQRGWKDLLEEFFKALAQHIYAPVQPNSIWITEVPAGTFTPLSAGPENRRQDLQALNETLLDWALTKPEFVYAPPLPPVIVLDEEQDQIDYSDLADPELEAKLQEGDAQLGISGKRAKKAD